MALDSSIMICLRASYFAAAIANVKPMRSPASASTAACHVVACDFAVSSPLARLRRPSLYPSSDAVGRMTIRTSVKSK